MMHDITEISDILKGDFQRKEQERLLFLQIREAANNDLWSMAGPFSPLGVCKDTGGLSLPIRVQVNTLRPWLEREKGSLYQHLPRVKVSRPTITSSRGKQKLTTSDADVLSEVATEWLRTRSLRAALENAAEQARLMPGCALKICFEKKKTTSPMSKLWVEVVSRWDAGWDERVDHECLSRYRYHLRWERLRDAKELFPDLASVEVPATNAVGDYLANGTSRESDPNRAKGYIQVLEWWDLEDEQVQLFVVGADNAVDAAGSKPFDIPYRCPDGSPLIQLIPLVLMSSVGQPMKAIPQALPYFYETCQKSYMTSLVMGALRRDFSRSILYREDDKDGLTKAVAQKVASSGDLELIGVDAKRLAGPLSDLYHAVQFPPISGTLDKGYQYMSMLSAESSATSAIGRGQAAGKGYASATEAQALAAGDAQVASLPAARMAGYMADLVRAAFVILGREREGLRVEVPGGKTETISPEKLLQEWQIELDDAAAKAAREAERRAALVQVGPIYQAAVTVASTATVPSPPGTPPVEIPESIRVAGERMVDLLVEAFQLGDDMRWKALLEKEADVDEKPEDDTAKMAEQLAGPPGPPAPPMAPPMPPEEPPVEELPVEDPAVQKMATTMSPEELAQVEAFLMQGGQ